LHHQAARGRKVIVVENPQLHLVWYYDRIFIKPIPRYLLSHAFWEYLRTKKELHQAAIGFLRTYSHLIRYERDFRLAVSDDLGLIPSDDGEQPITFERFAKFIKPFSALDDDDVNPRHHYGELRLTRLNMCVRLFLGKVTFHHVDAQWGTYLGKWLTPMLSLFAIFSVILSAMQVELAVQNNSKDINKWDIFSDISRWFSIATILLTAMGIVFLCLLIIFMFFHDIWFAQMVLRQERGRKCQGLREVDFKSGVI
jgi:hypothetical protein